MDIFFNGKILRRLAGREGGSQAEKHLGSTFRILLREEYTCKL